MIYQRMYNNGINVRIIQINAFTELVIKLSKPLVYKGLGIFNYIISNVKKD